MQKNNSKVINLGCRLNFFESEIIKNVLDKNDIKKKIIINTCAVTNQAVKKSLNEVRKASKDFPDHQIYVTGCASQIDERSFRNLKNVTKVIDNSKKTEPENYLGETNIKDTDTFNFPYLDNFSSDRSRAILQVQQGCDHRCTFCIIPYGRGEAKSLPFNEIYKRTKSMIKKGYSEIVLTGVDLTSYGQDLQGKPKLGNILKRLLSTIPELKRLRLSSIDPGEIDDDLLQLLLKNKKLLPHLHLSVQSGDNMILKRMKRRHNREQVINLCKKLKSSRSEFTFGADLIVGFPTETEEHFNNTLDLIKKCDFSNVHVFPFSPKEGTPAAKMPLVDTVIRKSRANYLRKESMNILFKKLESIVGKSTKILFESYNKSYTDEYFKVKLISSSRKIKSGSVINVKIVSRMEDFLLAELV